MDTLANFRDLGGYIGHGGLKVQPCRLLRSAQPVHISEQDRHDLVCTYKLRRIVDFRSRREADAEPDDRIEATQYHLVDILADTGKNDASRDAFMQGATAQGMESYMQRLYSAIAADKTACRGYREFIDLLLNTPDGATLFHCFAGKDRTGVAAAIILTVLGVSREDIYADYLKTNASRHEANEREFANAAKAGMSPTEIDALKVAMCVRREYLQATISTAEREYGSWEGFITTALQLTASEKQRLQQLYLA